MSLIGEEDPTRRHLRACISFFYLYLYINLLSVFSKDGFVVTTCGVYVRLVVIHAVLL